MTAPRTAADLLAAVRAFGPTVAGTDLSFATIPPPPLYDALRVLHTGVRALLSDRPWFGCGSTRDTACPRRLSPAMPIPAGITLLCVEGDDRWHRIPVTARDDQPHLFDVPMKAKQVAVKLTG